MKEKSTVIKRRKYDALFKEEVLRMVFNGRGVSEVAQSLGIGENLIYRWKSHYQKQSSATAAPITAGIVLPEEQQALHRRIKELEMERDILKKALGIFSRQT